MLRFLLSVVWTGLAIHASYGQRDSIVVKGKINNLNGRLYREAPFITFSRNNILAPSNELSVNAPLQPDGSFRAALPLAALEEEIYLDYGGKVYTTFLARKGEVEVTFDADSMFKAKKLFYFEGVNASANNFYPAYLEQESKLFESSKHLGPDFQKTFWNQGLQSAKQSLLQRGMLRQRALTALLADGKQSKELTDWINAIVEDERATFLMEYSLNNFTELGAADDMDIKAFSTTPLSYQKVLRANRFREYAARNAAVKNTSRRSVGSLPVDKIAGLVLQYVPSITIQERDKLRLIVEKKNVDRDELDFLSRVYKKGGDELATIANFERSVDPLRNAYDGPALEFLIAATFTDDFFKYSLHEKKWLYEHLIRGMHHSSLKTSLEELYRMEVKDSVNIQKVLSASVGSKPSEVLPNVWLAEGNANARNWLEDIQKIYAGRTIYVINWDIYNDLNREELESVNFLRPSVSEDVVFLFVHVSDPDRPQVTDSDQSSKERAIWKQYIVRYRLEGTHLFLNADQALQLGLRNPSIPGTYYIIRPDGRYHSRNAPAPSKIKEAADAIKSASQK